MIRPSPTTNNNFIRRFNGGKKEGSPQRETIKTNQIIIADFSFSNSALEKKKRRYPLWMVNKRQEKKDEDGNIFTSQGIVTSPLKEGVIQKPVFRNSRKAQAQSRSTGIEKKRTLVPFNFVKTKTHKHLNTISEVTNNFPVFYYESRGRGLYSALSERKPVSQPHKPVSQPRKSRKALSHSKPQIQSKSYTPKSYQLGAWNTIDVDFDDMI